MSFSRRSAISLVLCLAATAGSTFIALLALDRASGVTRPGGRCCETEFIDGAVLNTSWLLVPVIAVAAIFSARMALLGLLGVAVPQFLAMRETTERYEDSGWGQGLEVLGYLAPVSLTAVAALGLCVGWAIGRDRAQDQ